jgi:hypothetical protein
VSAHRVREAMARVQWLVILSLIVMHLIDVYRLKL